MTIKPKDSRYERGTTRGQVISSKQGVVQSTVERASAGPVYISSTVARFLHFATVLGLMPRFRLSCASPQSCLRTDRRRAFDSRSLDCYSDRVNRHDARIDGAPRLKRGAPVTNLSHNASLQSRERIATFNRGSKRLITADQLTCLALSEAL